MIYEKGSGVFLYKVENSEIKYLLLKYQIYGQTHWGFIKGRVEEGESYMEAAKREVLEETNLDNIDIEETFQEESSYQYEKDTGETTNKKVVFFVAEASSKYSGKVKISNEHIKFKWANYEEALKLLEFEGQKEILRKADSFIKSLIK